MSFSNTPYLVDFAVNHRVEDDLLVHVNRQAQRKFLQDVHSHMELVPPSGAGRGGSVADDQHTR